MNSITFTKTVRADAPRSARGMTLLEVLVVLATLGLLAVIALPAMCRTRPNNRALQCMNNTHILISAWQMYAQDNTDRLVTVVHGGGNFGGVGDPIYGVGWTSGWQDWGSSSENTNIQHLVDPRYAKLARYVKEARFYKCPSDTYISRLQFSLGWTERARSYSVNMTIGEGNYTSGPTDPIYKQVLKMTEFLNPSPSEAWVYTEEHPDSINDPAFFLPHSTSWIDIPSPLHNGATAFAFADGHSVMHKWERSVTGYRAATVLYNESGIGLPAAVQDPDVHWMSYHSPRNTSSSY